MRPDSARGRFPTTRRQFTKLPHPWQAPGREFDKNLSVEPKKPFDFPVAFAKIREAIRPFPRAALFELYDEGYTSTFEQLVACIISIRTYDEITNQAARRLFMRARTPVDMLRLSEHEIDSLIAQSTFHANKSRHIYEIARKIVEGWRGQLPCDYEALTSLEGVGPKCANLVLGIACKQPRIGVDIHVHRIANRWGIIATKTPE